MGRTLGVIFAALVLAGAAGATGSAPRATVTITDTRISPPRVRVDARGTVTWRNTGGAAHRVASSNRAFAAFTLAPGARRAVRFTRNGRHPYTVDGRRCGVVFVGVALGAGCTVGGSAPPPPTGTRTYTYDVTLRFMLKNEGFIDDQGRRTDEWTREYTWTSTVRNFKFKVTSYAGTNFIGLNAAGRAVRATAQFVDRYDYFWYPHNPEFFPPNADCEGSASGAVPIGFLASVGHPTTPNLKVHAQLDLPGFGTTTRSSRRTATAGRRATPTRARRSGSRMVPSSRATTPCTRWTSSGARAAGARLRVSSRSAGRSRSTPV